jgi:hypothetical protein
MRISSPTLKTVPGLLAPREQSSEGTPPTNLLSLNTSWGGGRVTTTQACRVPGRSQTRHPLWKSNTSECFSALQFLVVFSEHHGYQNRNYSKFVGLIIYESAGECNFCQPLRRTLQFCESAKGTTDFTPFAIRLSGLSARDTWLRCSSKISTVFSVLVPTSCRVFPSH